MKKEAENKEAGKIKESWTKGTIKGETMVLFEKAWKRGAK